MNTTTSVLQTQTPTTVEYNTTNPVVQWTSEGLLTKGTTIAGKRATKTFFTFVHTLLLSPAQPGEVAYSKSGHDCLHGPLNLAGIHRAQDSIHRNVYVVDCGVVYIWLSHIRLEVCGRISEKIESS